MKDIYCQVVSLSMGLCSPQQVSCLVTPACSPVALKKRKGDLEAKTIVTN